MRLFRSSVVLASLLIAPLLRAQQQFGVEAGPQYVLVSQVLDADLATLAGLTDIPTVNGWGVHAGVWYRSDRSHIIQFRLGINWSYRAFDQSYTRAELDTNLVLYTYAGTYTSHLHYIEVPAQASYYFWRNAHVDAGLAPGYLITGRFNDEGQVTYHYPDGSTYQPADYKSSVKDVSQYKRVEMALNAGFGYDFNNGLVAGISYCRALGRLNDTDEQFLSSYYNLFRVSFGYDFIHQKRRRQVFHHVAD